MSCSGAKLLLPVGEMLIRPAWADQARGWPLAKCLELLSLDRFGLIMAPRVSRKSGRKEGRHAQIIELVTKSIKAL